MDFDPSTWNQSVSIGVPILACLLAGNLMLVGWLVQTVRRLNDTVTGTFPVYTRRLEGVEATTKQHEVDLKEIGHLRERIAVLEYAQKRVQT